MQPTDPNAPAGTITIPLTPEQERQLQEHADTCPSCAEVNAGQAPTEARCEAGNALIWSFGADLRAAAFEATSNVPTPPDWLTPKEREFKAVLAEHEKRTRRTPLIPAHLFREHVDGRVGAPEESERLGLYQVHDEVQIVPYGETRTFSAATGGQERAVVSGLATLPGVCAGRGGDVRRATGREGGRSGAREHRHRGQGGSPGARTVGQREAHGPPFVVPVLRAGEPFEDGMGRTRTFSAAALRNLHEAQGWGAPMPKPGPLQISCTVDYLLDETTDPVTLVAEIRPMSTPTGRALADMRAAGFPIEVRPVFVINQTLQDGTIERCIIVDAQVGPVRPARRVAGIMPERATIDAPPPMDVLEGLRIDTHGKSRMITVLLAEALEWIQNPKPDAALRMDLIERLKKAVGP